jgi:hypothetical protein
MRVLAAHGPPTQRDFAVAHLKFNPEYTLSKKPEIIAEWIHADSLNLSYGLDREKYGAAGYRLRYLVYAGLKEPAEPIASGQGMHEDAINGLIQKGYDFAIVVRE